MAFITGDVTEEENKVQITPPIMDKPQEFVPKVYNKPYEHSVVDNRLKADTSVITFIPGYQWTIHYYSQMIGRDEGLSVYSPNQLPVYQSYHLIKDFEVKLQGELSPSIDEADSSLTISGTAILYPSIIPNNGDCFIADIGDGNAGLFTVTHSLPKTHFKQTTYEIQFELIRYMTQSIESELATRVIKTSHFVKNRYLYGQDPIIISDDYNRIKTLQECNALLINQWLQAFYSPEYSTLRVPTSPMVVYDPYVMRAVTSVLEQKEHPILPQMRIYACNEKYIESNIDLYKLVLGREKQLLPFIFKKFKCTSARNGHWNPQLSDFRYSRMSHLVEPAEEIQNGDSDGIYFEGWTGDALTPSTPSTPEAYVSGLIHPVHKDGYYVFSEAFYEMQTDQMSDLEAMVHQFLREEMISPVKLIELHTAYRTWSRLDRFYYGILLITLTKGLLRTM